MVATSRLLDLQAVDSAIARLEHRRRALEEGDGLAVARTDADAAENQLGGLRLRLDEFDRDGSRFEHEIDSLTQKATAEQKRLFDGSVANAKELESIQHEVDSLRKRQSDREDELLVLLEQREEVQRQADEAGARAAEARTLVAQVGDDEEQDLGRVVAELADRRAERQRLADGIDPELLELYDDLRRTKKGVGAAALVDGVCQGCHEQLSAVELDRLKKAQGIQRCDHCRRILVL